MNGFFQLTRCPLCKENASGPFGCCQACKNTLFRPIVTNNELALGPYQGSLEKAVRALKYHQVSRLGSLFGKELARLIRQEGWQIDHVTAIPLHWFRYLQRGYNQAALIAKPLAQELGLPYSSLLKRTRYTKQQAKLSGSERQQNIQGVFQSQTLTGQRILLIDDVITTGLTIKAGEDALLAAGATEVKLASVAKVVKRAFYT
jgi:ComF family protein